MAVWRQACGVVLFSALAAAAGPPTPDYELVWHDEFDGDSLDAAKWGYRQLGPRRDGINVKECVALDGEGHLTLTTKRVGDVFHTAMIGTDGRYSARFGYFECRVQLQDEKGHWSAFWLQSPTVTTVGDPKTTGTEIDIFEYLVKNPETLQFNLHWDGYGKDHKHAGSRATIPGLDEGFHTVSLEWTPDEYVFRVDGKECWRTQKGVSHVEQYIILSLEVGKWAGDIRKVELPDSLVVDYVRVYQKVGRNAEDTAEPQPE